MVFLAYDLLELAGTDFRERPMVERRTHLEALVPDQSPRLKISPTLDATSWYELSRTRERARSLGVEGLMIKRLTSSYMSGRPKGDWWKWKVVPLTIDTVMIYAQAGHGKRASLYTDYTFGVWDGDELKPVAKAYSGLNQDEIDELDRWIRRNTLERFGPVRSVKPEQVFELAFDDVQESKRHKSGLALRFPRIARWRRDKRPEEADTLEHVRELLESKRDR